MSDTTGGLILPESFKVKLKRLSKILKENIPMDMTTITQNVKPNSRIIVNFPTNSIIDLTSFAMFFDAEIVGDDGAGRVANGPDGYVAKKYFPRNTSSFVQQFTVKINGGIQINIPDYNFLYNLLYQYTAGAQDSQRRRQVGGENADPSSKVFMVDGKPFPVRGYALGSKAAGHEDVIKDKDTYCIRSWLSLFGGNASTSILDTQSVGTITVEIVLAPGNMLMLGTQTSAIAALAGDGTGGLQINDFKPYFDETGTTAPGAAIGRGGVLAGATSHDYTLNNVKFSITRYHLDPAFYEAQANMLSGGKAYPIYFPNYSIFPQGGVPANNKQSVFRTTVSTKALEYVIGTFRLANYDTVKPVMNSIVAPQKALNTGSSAATADSLVAAGAPLVYNQSAYFAANGDSIEHCKWRIGGTNFESEDLDAQFNALLMHYNIHQDTMSGLHPSINSKYAFRTHSYAHVCSLNVPDPDSGHYVIGGLDSEQSTISIEWQVTSKALTADHTYQGNNIITPAAGDRCIPYIICCHNSALNIYEGRVIELIP